MLPNTYPCDERLLHLDPRILSRPWAPKETERSSGTGSDTAGLLAELGHLLTARGAQPARNPRIAVIVVGS